MKVVDLFSGCGGFSLGASNAGCDVVLSFDIDPILTSSYKANFIGANLVLGDVSKLSGEDCMKLAGGSVDGIVGGPPCQGFSSIGKRLKSDPRRSLLIHFFRVVSEVRPKFFVMENVKGVIHDHSSKLLKKGLDIVRSDFYVTDPMVLDAANFGAATKRPRVFVFGFRRDLNLDFSDASLDRFRCPSTTVREAISDLSDATALGLDDQGFDVWQLKNHSKISCYARNLRSANAQFTGNISTRHTDAVRDRFSLVEPGKTDQVGRHPRLSWNGQAPTQRAGTGSDRGSFQSLRPIHPEESRVITVREAARLQGFPDEFRFHPTIWHSFRMIGNSVVPTLAKAALSAVIDLIEDRDCIKCTAVQL